MISYKFWKISLKQSYLVPSTAPTSVTIPLKVLSIPDLVSFLVAFMCLPHLLVLSVPVLVWLLLFSEGVGAWTNYSPFSILLNVSPGRLLLGVLIPFFLLCGSSVLWGVHWSFFLHDWLGFLLGYLSQNFVNDQGSDWVFSLDFCQYFTFSFYFSIY